MAVIFSADKNVDTGQLNDLWKSIGWRPRRHEKWEEALSKSSFVYSAWHGKTLIGFGRILEDGVMCMFYDIAVRPSFQNKGIGTKIILKLIERVKEKRYASIGLFAWKDNPKNMPFYERFGFEKVKSGMELVKYMKRE